MLIRWKSSLWYVSRLLFLWARASLRALGQCAGIATTPVPASDSAAHAVAQNRAASIDLSHRYSRAELVDIAERNNPSRRILWERAKQRAEALEIDKSAYYPVLAGVATFGDRRTIVSFPKPLAYNRYVMAELSIVQPKVTLPYLIFDFVKREGRVDGAAAEKIATGANFIAAPASHIPDRVRILQTF